MSRLSFWISLVAMCVCACSFTFSPDVPNTAHSESRAYAASEQRNRASLWPIEHLPTARRLSPALAVVLVYQPASMDLGRRPATVEKIASDTPAVSASSLVATFPAYYSKPEFVRRGLARPSHIRTHSICFSRAGHLSARIQFVLCHVVAWSSSWDMSFQRGLHEVYTLFLQRPRLGFVTAK